MNRILLTAFLSLSITMNKEIHPPRFDDSVLKATRKNLYIQCKKDYQRCQLDSFMTSLHESSRYNGVILVAENGEIVYEKAFGCFRKDSAQVFCTTTNMQLASVSKPFTAMAALMLIEQGLLSYNDDLKKFFPNFPHKGITIRHLLNHTSGLPDYINRPGIFERHIRNKKQHDKNLDFDNEDLLNLIIKHRIPLDFKPGVRHHYSNTGYALLALVIEKTSGIPFARFIETRIFDRLGMCNSFLYSKDKKIKMFRDDYRDGILGDKGVFSTVEDMFKWDQALYTEKLVKRATLDSAFTPGKTASAERFDYGYGWRIRPTEAAERVIYHRGFWQDATPMLIRFIDCNRTIISLHHPIRYDSWRMVDTIAEIMNDSEGFCSSDQ